jgi:ArsR family transcriptional regulator
MVMEVEYNIEENTEQQAGIFSALADPTRLKLVKLLCHQQSTSALCVNALAELLGVTQSAVSQHLRVLKAIGLVRGERRGYHIHYFVNLEALESYRRLASEILSMGGPRYEKLCENYCNKEDK